MEIEESSHQGEVKMKEDLSRQEGTYGAKMIGKLKKMRCAVIGLRGIGIEVAKNLMLAGPHTVMVHDDENAEFADMGTNFYITEEDVKSKKSRSGACEKSLSEINPNTYFEVHKGDLKKEDLDGFDVVIFADNTPLSKLYEMNEYLRKKGKKFIYANTYGLLLTIFSDFGTEHEIFDASGEAERTIVIDKVEIVNEPYDSIEEFLKSEAGGKSDEEVGKMGYKDKKVAAIGILKSIAGIEMDEKRQKSISIPEILNLADKNDKTCKKSKCGKITTEGERSLLSDREYIKFDEIIMSKSQADSKNSEGGHIFKLGQKITDINSICQIKTHRTNPSVFYIGDISDLGEYQGGGMGSQVKLAIKESYESLKKQYTAPSFEQFFTDMSHTFEEAKQHVAWAAVKTFEEENGHLPCMHDEKDADACIKIAKKFEWAEAIGGFDETFIRKASLFARAETNALAAFAGGIVAQEAMKQTGKYTPMKQWIYMHALQLLSLEKASKAVGDRYDYYRCLFGDSFVANAKKAKFFLVGCGALGCEFLKNIALTGLGCSNEGAVHVTDDDVIELSNLSRQFLFRRKHVGKLKAECASGSAVDMNPDLKCGLKLHTTRVEPKTENEFSDKFWQSLDFVINALDNIKARYYVDTKCVTFGKPLFESGTLGTQANQTVHVPKKTPCYQEGSPPGEGQGIAMCTLTFFPFEPLHCIEWSRVMFGSVFEDGPSAYEDLRKSGVEKYLEKTGKNISEEKDTLEKTLKWVKIASNPTLEQCVKLAMDHFLQFFRDECKNLIHTFPKDARKVDKKSGEDRGPFWHGRRRFPRPHEEFDAKNQDHVDFVYHTTCIFADTFGLTKGGYPDEKEVLKLAATTETAEWTPKKENVDDPEGGGEQKGATMVSSDDYEEIENMRKEIQKLDVDKLVKLFPAEFEKDDDTNHHVDWITIASNLRGWTRNLKPSTKQHCRMIAGRIIAAIATATASITGLVFMEVYKQILAVENIDDYRWSTINLAVNTYVIELPCDPKCHRSGKMVTEEVQDDEVVEVKKILTCIPDKFTCYDFIDFKDGKDLKISEFIERFAKQEGGLKINFLSRKSNNKGVPMYQEINVAMYQNKKKFSERMLQRMKNPTQKKILQQSIDTANAMLEQATSYDNMTVFEAYTKAYGPLEDPNREFLVLDADVTPTDRELEDGEEIEIPAIKYYFR
mmetsp:Transcript_1133/g.1581  ORF Transcript_1133/g.1581 Transcript_1133/m.1581 type:complete len:1190 (-) Transcript_1133:306-3875(-)